MRLVIRERERIGDTGAGKGEPRLAGEPRDRVRHAETLRMRAALEKAGIKERRHLGRRHRAVGDPPRPRLHLDQGFEPGGAARAVAHDLDLGPAGRGPVPDRLHHLLGAERERGGLAGDEDPDRRAHDRPPLRRAPTSASKRRSSTRPKTSSSIITAGAAAQLPRQ